MMRNVILVLIFIWLPYIMAYSQPVIGFWGVDSVTVGGRNVTPVAKWFIYDSDHTYRGGNGWSQNDVGTWTYDEHKSEFMPTSKLGAPDEFGAFHVKVFGSRMVWERDEDGMQVVVTLTRIQEMPMSPTDMIPGKWDLVSATQGQFDVTEKYDPNDHHRIDVRRGQTYTLIRPDSSESFGYWHMDAHEPEFHLIDFDRNVDFEVYTVSFEQDQLVMRPKKNTNLTLVYGRF